MSQAVRTTGSEAGISQPIESQPIKNKTDTDSYRLMTEAIDSIRQAEEAVERLARFRMQQKMSNNRAKKRCPGVERAGKSAVVVYQLTVY